MTAGFARSAYCDVATGRLVADIVAKVNDARATRSLAAITELCVPGIFEDNDRLGDALAFIARLDVHATRLGPTELTMTANEVIISDSPFMREVETVGWTIWHEPDLAGVIDGWMRVVCGQWDVIPELLGWTDSAESRWPTWDLRWGMNEIRARHARRPFNVAACSQSIAAAPEPARRAYRVWQRLAGGAHQQWTVPVDGEFRWDVVE